MHTHTTCCDGNNTIEEMIQDAVKAGFDVLGFSGHSYTSYDERYCMSREDTAFYQDEVRRLAEKYKNQIHILCGIEQDRYADDAPDTYDYAIGSVHTFFRPCTPLEMQEVCAHAPESIIPDENGCYIYADWSDQAMEWAIDILYGGNPAALAEDYFETVASYAEDADIQIVGHFDLLTKFEELRVKNGKQPLFDTEHPRYLDAARRAIEALCAAGKIFEINTGAMSKNYRTSPYPSLPLLRMIYQAGGRIMINSDCHAAGKLDCGYEEAKELARQAGYKYLSYPLSGGKITEVPL